MPDDGWRYELVQGRLVRMPPMGFSHGRITANVIGLLQQFVREQRLGVILSSETGFILSREGEPDTVLAPDAAFVSAERVPAHDVPGFARLAPDLVAEVVSPGQARSRMEVKARLYIASGVRLVWVVWPETQTVDVWRETGTTSLSEGDTLDGGDVLPGLAIPVRDLFT
jgi:Uma2 family endonuclease